MKTQIVWIIVSAFIVQGVINFDWAGKQESILKENLNAAISFENNLIRTCASTKPYDYKLDKIKTPLFEGLGSYTFSISTESEEAQLYFNQGINLTYGFNHDEAHRSFLEASLLSEESAMCYWGQAYVLGPNINDYQLEEERKRKAYDAIENALKRIDQANELEKALILALSTRYVLNENDSVSINNEAYMVEMENVSKKFSQNTDVLTLYAASIMNTMPWDYWAKDLTPNENTLKAKEALEKALSINPNHPGALHYHIHLTELPFPELAAKSGDALAPLMPGAGHMVHMPSHAYVRVGRYIDAAEANMKAIASDEKYISQCYSQGIYPLGYYPHNVHFLWMSATLMGDSKTALAAAKKTAVKVSIGQLAEMEFMQEFASVPIQSYVRFGKWNNILTIPDPGDNLKHYKLIWHYGRAMAFIRKANLDEAEEELLALKSIADDASYDNVYASLNHSGDVTDIAYHVVAGEYYSALGKPDKADDHFKLAIQSEDHLTYTEPPSWHMPTRENYGAFLIKQKRFDQAELVYKENLREYKHNGWSLIGLHKAYKGLGKEDEAKEILEKFQDSWQYADIEIRSSVF